MIDIEKFKESCNKKRCIRGTMITNNCTKEYKREQCYKTYTQKQEKDKAKQEAKKAERQAEIDEYKRKKEAGEEIIYKDSDPKWTALLKELWVRDNAQCRFFSIMTKEEQSKIIPHLWGDFKKLDGCHILARSVSIKNKYNIDNAVLLYRWIHQSLDNCRDPFTEENITKEVRDTYWIRIIGLELWNKLQENK